MGSERIEQVQLSKIELGSEEKRPYTTHSQRTVRRLSWYKLPLFIVSIFLFVLAISLMKEGANALIPFVENSFQINNPSNSLGFGWIFAYIIMSGSPVAAAALTFLDAGLIDTISAFTMVTGSRLGASFIVLFIGFIYVIRGRNKATSLDMGLLSLIVTATTHIPALFLGAVILQYQWLDHVQLGSGALLNGVFDAIFAPIISLLSSHLPQALLFIVGLFIIMVSFSLFDRCLPQMSLKESHMGQLSRLVYKPIIMFTLGGALTLISMSVSVSLSLLVPLSARGFVRRENVIPYIMGAGVSTFIDTLFAAVLLNNPDAFTVVLVEMFAVMVLSLLIMAVFYRRYERAVLAFTGWVTSDNRHFAYFMGVILLLPLLLLFV